ncbi:hypothetical protein ACNKHS_07490 [Shigella flexneri]
MIVYPTDSGYALGCKIEEKGRWSVSVASASCRRPRLHLMCRDLSELSTYALWIMFVSFNEKQHAG